MFKMVLMEQMLIMVVIMDAIMVAEQIHKIVDVQTTIVDVNLVLVENNSQETEYFIFIYSDLFTKRNKYGKI